MNPEEFETALCEFHDVLYKAAKDTRLYNLLMTCATTCTGTGSSSCAPRGNRMLAVDARRDGCLDTKQEPETGCKARKKAYDEGQGRYQEEDQAGPGASQTILKV